MREVRLRQLLMLWSLISMTEPKIAALDAAKIWQLFNLGGTVLVSAEHDGKTDMMPASWASPLDYDKVLVVVDKSHYTRKLMDQSEYFALGVASAGILPELLSLGSVSKNADPEKLEKSGMALFTQPGFKIPLARGCSAWAIFKKLPETDELSKKYDLFLGQAVAAWGDERVYQNGRPDFEHAPKRCAPRITFPAAVSSSSVKRSTWSRQRSNLSALPFSL